MCEGNSALKWYLSKGNSPQMWYLCVDNSAQKWYLCKNNSAHCEGEGVDEDSDSEKIEFYFANYSIQKFTIKSYPHCLCQ